MIGALALVAVLQVSGAGTSSAPSAVYPDAATRPAFPIHVEGRTFIDAAGRAFTWRGITAFRLAEMIANGREHEAIAYLDWAKSEQLTVVRVLLTAQHLFRLSPEAGRVALPRLLELAKTRGIAVEAVALADTKDVTLDYEAHIREVGRIAQEYGNAFVELANEPGHPTQDARVHDPEFLQTLAAQLPGPLLVALGSVEYGDRLAAGDYVTTHVPRGEQQWDHVLAIAAGVKHVIANQKPVVSDEPIGAAPVYQPGRRDDEPSRFAAAGALTRFVGMSGTFHYEGGLHARIPGEREAACLAAWQTGLALLNGMPLDGEFVMGSRLANIAQTSGVRAAFGRVRAGGAVLLLVDPAAIAAVTPAAGWKEARRTGVPGVQIVVLERSSG